MATVEADALLGQQRDKPFMREPERAQRGLAFGVGALVGNHDQGKTGLRKLTQRRGNSWQQPDVLGGQRRFARANVGTAFKGDRGTTSTNTWTASGLRLCYNRAERRGRADPPNGDARNSDD